MAARLGKRERDAKRALIKGNVANLSQMERSSGMLGCTLTTDSRGRTIHILSRTHTSFRDPQNIKGGSGQARTHGAPGTNAKMADGRACYVAKK